MKTKMALPAILYPFAAGDYSVRGDPTRLSTKCLAHDGVGVVGGELEELVAHGAVQAFDLAGRGG